jgi:predicted ATPase
MDAALSVRDEAGRTGDVRSIFHRVSDRYDEAMSFEAEMIIPQTGTDDLGQEAKASTTFLRYRLGLALRAEEPSSRPSGSIEIVSEELTHIKLGDASRELAFPEQPTWRRSALTGARRTPYFISTEGVGPDRMVQLHQDQIKGRPLRRLAATLPRTVLSAANAAESPTALLARQEMQSWRLLQLEPSALRRPDNLNAPFRLGADGSHLASTLYHLAHANGVGGVNDEGRTARLYAQVASRLSDLIDDVREVWVERDDKREILTLHVAGGDRTDHPARALSDGTLRFLALAVVELDPEATGLICLEEPENGVHPKRIPAMLELLGDIVTDTELAIGPDNPLRQVIINTHSPAVVAQVPDDSLLVAELVNVESSPRSRAVRFASLPDTWRTEANKGAPVVAKGRLLDYLSPVRLHEDEQAFSRLGAVLAAKSGKRKRVVDRPDLQIMLPFPDA